jgi:hypothetical protein
LNILAGQPWIIAQDVRFGPPLGQEIDDERYAETRAPDHRFSYQDLWVNDNPIPPIHCTPFSTFDWCHILPPARHLSNSVHQAASTEAM